MTTKPEGPKGYVAHKFVVSGNGNKCGVCGVAHNGDASTWVPDVPATPAPSQPAARDWEYPPEVKSILARCEANVVSFSNDDVSTLLVAIDQLAQQTAAKDAINLANVDELERTQELAAQLERERDSLREANARLAAELDAALKAGKDGQK